MRLPAPEPESDGPNLTPVIDVVFLLLIFFLVATKFDQQERLVSINLAEIFKPEPMAVGSKEVIVNITSGAYLGDRHQGGPHEKSQHRTDRE